MIKYIDDLAHTVLLIVALVSVISALFGKYDTRSSSPNYTATVIVVAAMIYVPIRFFIKERNKS